MLSVALKPIWRTNVMIGNFTNDFKKYNIRLEDAYWLSFLMKVIKFKMWCFFIAFIAEKASDCAEHQSG